MLTTPEQTPVIAFRDVRLVLGGVSIYAGLNIDIQEGEFICLLGPSGCGKSTVLRLASGLIEASGGQISVFGEPPLARQDDFAFVFQSPRLVPWRSALSNVVLGAQLRSGRINKREAEKKARDLLELVGLARDVDKMPAIMSGGERQRVSIARALMVEPRIILMDEPFSALDPGTRDRMRREIVNIWQRTGKTVVFVTHDVDEALLLADRIVVLSYKPTRVLDVISITRPRWRNLQDDPVMIETRERLDALMNHKEHGEDR